MKISNYNTYEFACIIYISCKKGSNEKMNIRPIKNNEIILLTDFLYEAIFQKDANNWHQELLSKTHLYGFILMNLVLKRMTIVSLQNLIRKLLVLFGFVVLKPSVILMMIFQSLQYQFIHSIAVKGLEQH